MCTFEHIVTPICSLPSYQYPKMGAFYPCNMKWHFQNLHTPEPFKTLKSGSQSETTKEEKNCDTLPNSQHCRGRRACWSFRMGLDWTHKWEFKMKSTCTSKKRGRLLQIEWKCCGGLSKNNFKHKFYMACNLWEEALLPPYGIFCAYPQGLHLNVTFPQNS
jgi:hypothetical protein